MQTLYNLHNDFFPKPLDKQAKLWYTIYRKKRERYSTMKKKGILSTILAFLLMGYSIFCYGEVLLKNGKPNPQYSKINIVYYILNSEKGRALQ